MNKYDTASTTGAIVTVFASLTLSDWGVIIGILFGLFTLLMNWYYKDKELKLKEKYFKKQVSVKDLDDEQKS